MQNDILVNGKRQTKISVYERVVQFGDGVFETCLLKNGQIEYWELHFHRLCLGLKRLKIPPIKATILLADIRKMIHKDGVIKIIVSRGQSLRGYGYEAQIKPTRIVIYSPIPPIKDRYQLGICQTRYHANPILAGIKHNNRLEQILARASVRGDEGVMLDESGFVISATAANIFIIKDGVIKTPDLTNCGIEGTRRHLILQKTNALICNISLDELLGADVVFLTSAVIGIKPVYQIQNRIFSNDSLSDEISF